MAGCDVEGDWLVQVGVEKRVGTVEVRCRREEVEETWIEGRGKDAVG